MRVRAWLPLIGLLVLAPSARASTYYVDHASSSCSNTGSGSSSQPYCSISAAVTARAGAGNTIVVKPGVYREQVTVSASGTASSPFVLQASGSGVVVDGSDDFSSTSLWHQLGGNVWLAASVTTAPVQVFADGARLTEAAGVAPASLTARTWTWVSGEGLYVNAAGGNPGGHDAQVGKRSYGFRLDRRSWVTVDGFEVRNCESRDIYLTGPLTGTIVSNNRCTFAGKNGIAALACSSVVVRHNVCSDHQDHGIYFQGTVKSTAEDNESMRNARPTVRAANGMNLSRSTGNVIQRNRLHHNQDTGLDFETGANDNLSRQNLLYLNGDHGTDHVDCSGNVHIGDVAYRNYKDGFSFEGSATGHKVFDCIGIENGLTTVEFDLWIDQSSLPGFESDYNIWWNSSASGTTPIKYIATKYAKLGDYQAASGQDAHSLQIDPMFADTSLADFHLRDGSPAIDAGTSAFAGWPSTDFDGRARWDDPITPNTGAGAVPYGERGAFEFFANTKPVAALSVDQSSGGAPLAVTASGAASTDKDGKIVSYTFDFGDGTVIGPQPAPTASHVYPLGEYTLRITVTDNREGADTAAVPIVVVPNLASNPGFEDGTSGWTKYGSATLTQAAGGHSGSYALQVKGGSSSSSSFGADDSPNIVTQVAGMGSRYRFDAWVRSATFKGKVALEVREYLGSSQKGSSTKSASVTLSPTWQRLTVDYTATTDGTTLDLHIADTPTKSSEIFFIDDVSATVLWAPPPPPPPVPGNLVGNWSFESNTSGWSKSGSATLSRVLGGHLGGYSLQVKGSSSSSSSFGVDDSPNWASTNDGPGTVYRFGAWVRSPSYVGKVTLELREMLAGVQRGIAKSSPVTLSPAWQYLTVDYTVTTPLTALDLRIVDAPTKSYETWFLDDVTLMLATPADRPPVVTAPDTLRIPIGSSAIVNVAAADPDGEAIDSLVVNATALPDTNDGAFALDSGNGGGVFTWTPRPADIRATPYLVVFTAHNALAGSHTTRISVVDTTTDTLTTSGPPPPPPNDNLVGNPGFETDLSGWATYGSATLARVAGGHSGAFALQVTGSSSFGCDDVPNWVTTVAGAGAKYRVSAWVRSTANVGKVKIRIYEYQGSSQQGSTVYSQEVALTPTWQQLVADYTVLKAGSTLSIRVTNAAVASSEVFLVDDVSITLVSGAAVTAAGASRSEAVSAGMSARAFAVGAVGSGDDAGPWVVRIQGIDGPGWEGVVPRVVLVRDGREAIATRLRFGEDGNGDGREEIGAEFDVQALRAMLGSAGDAREVEATLFARGADGVSWSTAFPLVLEPPPATFAAWFGPNPMHGSGALTFTLTRPGDARVDLYDTSGRRVRTLFDRRGLSPGKFRVGLDAHGSLASGLYFWTLESGEGTRRGRIAIVR